jgi:hypothetical protein
MAIQSIAEMLLDLFTVISKSTAEHNFIAFASLLSKCACFPDIGATLNLK